MAYTFSFDASVKITQTSNLAGYLNHFAREENEIEINHSNENIDPSRTHENLTFIYDENGKANLALSKSHEQIEDALYKRWGDAVNLDEGTYKTTGKKVRKDAVLAFGMIMQIDPNYYKDTKAVIDAKYDPKLYPKENKRAWEKFTRHSTGDLLKLARDRFGEKNIVAMSIHMDETNPHVHFLMTPITDDGRLSQKEFINKSKLKQMHGEFRKTLRERGYDIDLERKTPVNAKRLSEKDYKELQASLEESERIKADKIALNTEKAQFEAYRVLQEQEIEKLKRQARDKMDKADEAWHIAVEAQKLPQPQPERASRMASFMSKYKLNDGRTLYQHFQDAEPSIIQTEESNHKLMEKLNRQYERMSKSFNNDYDMDL